MGRRYGWTLVASWQLEVAHGHVDGRARRLPDVVGRVPRVLLAPPLLGIQVVGHGLGTGPVNRLRGVQSAHEENGSAHRRHAGVELRCRYLCLHAPRIRLDVVGIDVLHQHPRLRQTLVPATAGIDAIIHGHQDVVTAGRGHRCQLLPELRLRVEHPHARQDVGQLDATGDVQLVAHNDAGMLTAILLQTGHIGPHILLRVVALHIGDGAQRLLGIIVVQDAAHRIQVPVAHRIQREAAAIQLNGRYGHPGVPQRAVAEAKGMDVLLQADIVGPAHDEEFVVEDGSAKVA